MNMKITKKSLQENYNYIVRAGYCELWNITREAEKVGYTYGVYGWNWTAYELEATNGERVAICTGYRDMTGSYIEGKTKFEEKAKKINSDYSMPYEKIQKKAKQNAKKFADYCIEQIKKLGD